MIRLPPTDPPSREPRQYQSIESNGHTVRRRRDRPERTRFALLQRRFVPRTRNMRFRNCDSDRREFAGVPAECTRTCGVG
jgi:hypothetical protein